MAKADELKAKLGLSGPPLAPIPRVPARIPDHELVRRIGRGSYGEVWLARSVVGTWRAVKVVYRDHFKDVRPYEREFAGIQKYEPISRTNEGLVDVLQIGRNDAEGYFYYVMELADDAQPARSDGVMASSSAAQAAQHSAPPSAQDSGPPTVQSSVAYVPKTLAREIESRGRLSVEECITLGMTLNLALGHLHRRGLIHRDVKPSNIIFVNGVPKLADIGLVTDLAAAQSFVGTEGFIPPEGPNSPQADLYALGKVLYEAAMGKDRQEFPEPFTALGADAESKSLMELNEVLLSACAEKPKQRYQTAEEMNADLALLHSGKSVQSKHALERRLKLMTRVGLAAAAVTVLGAFPYYLAIREANLARVAAREKVVQLRRANQAALEAAAEKRKAQTEAAKSQEVVQFLKDMLKLVDPSRALRRDPTMVREILDETAGRVATKLTGQPDIDAELRSILGSTYYGLGDYAKAEEMHRGALRLREKVFGAPNQFVAASLNDLGNALAMQDRQAEAEVLKRQGLAMRRNFFGDQHPEVADSLSSLADTLTDELKLAEAERVQREALTMQRRFLGEDRPEVTVSLNNLGRLLRRGGRLAEAEAVFREALALARRRGSENLALADALFRLASVLHHQGKLTETEKLWQEALRIQSNLLGSEHDEVAFTLNSLADLVREEGRPAEAEALYRERLQELRGRLPGDDPRVLSAPLPLAVHLLNQGLFTEAEALARESLAAWEKHFPEAAETFISRSLLGCSLLGLKRYAEAEPLLLSGYEGMKQREGKMRDQYKAFLRRVLESVVQLYAATRRTEQAARWNEKLTQWYRGQLEQLHGLAEQGDFEPLRELAWLLATCEAAEIRDGPRAVHYAEKAVAATNGKNGMVLDILAAAHAEAGQFAKAVSVQQQAIALLGDERSKNALASRLKLYESSVPYREGEQ